MASTDYHLFRPRNGKYIYVCVFTVYVRLMLFNKFNRQSVELFLERSHSLRSAVRKSSHSPFLFFFSSAFIAIGFFQTIFSVG